MDNPPDDPQVWTDEQWIEWLDEQPSDEPASEERVYAPQLSSRAGTVVGAAMMGLEIGIYGDIQKPEVVIEAEASGQDDGIEVDLDPDDPSHSTVVVNRRPDR